MPRLLRTCVNFLFRVLVVVIVHNIVFYRFVSARSIKENFVGLESYLYPSNLV